MATFYNRATLSYNNGSIESNTVTGELLEVLSASKQAIEGGYEPNDTVTYIVSIVNTGSTPFTGLSVTDDLGAYAFGTSTLVPLDYVDGSAQYYINGSAQAAPAVTAGPPLVFSGITIPAGGNAAIIYQARANEYAPLGDGSLITNTAVVSGGGLSAEVDATATVSASTELGLTISKTLSPDTVAENGQLTYTFIIQNSGSVPAVSTDNIVVTDTFSPILDPIAVTFEGTAWTESVDYSYDGTTGLFSTTAGSITVPAATYIQDADTGEWSTIPGVAVLKVTGTV